MASETKHEKYRDALTKAALGELSERREVELLAHTAECESCREEYARARELREIVDRGVNSVVAGEPSAGFEARLRARLADAPARWRAAWVPATAGACALAGLLLMTAIRVPRQNSSQNGTEAAITTADSAAPAVGSKPAGTACCAPTEEPSPQREIAMATAEKPPRWLGANRASHGAHRQEARERQTPEVIVPPGQMEALAQFAALEKKIDPKQLEAEQEALQRPIEIQPIQVKPIEIKTIQIPPVDVNRPRAASDVPFAAPTSDARFLPVAP